VTLVEETVKSTFIHRLFELKCDGGKASCDHFQCVLTLLQHVLFWCDVVVMWL
jgi:hypothetical protein